MTIVYIIVILFLATRSISIIESNLEVGGDILTFHKSKKSTYFP
jgi:hypothetical protein